MSWWNADILLRAFGRRSTRCSIPELILSPSHSRCTATKNKLYKHETKCSRRRITELKCIVIFLDHVLSVRQPVLVSVALAGLKRHQSGLCANEEGFPSYWRDGIVLCYTQDTRIHTRGQKLGFVGASNISKEKKGAAECSEQRTVLQRWRQNGSGTAWCGSRTRRSWSSAPTPRTRCCTRLCWWGTRILPSPLGIERRQARKVAPTTVSEKVTSNKVSRMASWSFEGHIAGENVNNGKGRFP